MALPCFDDANGGSPICQVLLEGGQLIVRVLVDDLEVKRAVRDGVCRNRLQELTRTHRSALLDGWAPSPFDLWSSATEAYLAEVYQIVSGLVVDLVGHYARIGLAVNDPVLWSLPIETAHNPDGACVVDLTQVYRLVPEPRPGFRYFTSEGRRGFRLELAPCDNSGLHSVQAEQVLVRAVHQARIPHWLDDGPAANRGKKPCPLVHLVGHEPTLGKVQGQIAELDPDDNAHIVGSGCDSLPRCLAPGVSSATGTLWPIDDLANASFVATFHARLAIGVAPAEALRQAQLLHRTAPPVIWAPYVHVGQAY